MRRSTKRASFILLIFIFASLGIPMAAAHAEDVGYSVRAVIPGNQVDKYQTYFDLLMKPGQKQVIQVEIYNSSNIDTDIQIYITNPMTNRNGLIDYTNTHTKVDESLKVPITKIASIGEKTVNVPAKGSKIVPIQLQMPKEQFDGMILGGIYFEKSPSEAESKNKQITNKYSYVLGLKLTETNKKIKPSLHLKSVKPGLVNYHTAVIANIQNSAPVIVDKLLLKAKVYNSNGKLLNQADVKDYRMAPNSNMDFPIDWKNQELKPGKYTLKLSAETGKKHWNWQKEFVIPAQKANDLNNQAVEITRDYTWYLILGLSVIILILLFVIFRMMRKR